MFRAFLIIFFTVFIVQAAYCNHLYDMSTPLKGQSIASNSLQIDVLQKIYPIALKKNSLCTEFKVIDTQLLHYPYDVVKKNGKYVKGYWKELWTVDYCTGKLQIPVTFVINKKKTAFFVENVN